MGMHEPVRPPVCLSESVCMFVVSLSLMVTLWSELERVCYSAKSIKQPNKDCFGDVWLLGCLLWTFSECELLFLSRVMILFWNSACEAAVIHTSQFLTQQRPSSSLQHGCKASTFSGFAYSQDISTALMECTGLVFAS